MLVSALLITQLLFEHCVITSVCVITQYDFAFCYHKQQELYEHMRARLSTGLVHGVLYIKQMYTVSYFEIYCDDGIPEATREYFNTYQEAQAYAKSFEDWEDVRVDKVPLQPDVLPF